MTAIPEWRKFVVPVADIKSPGDITKIPLRGSAQKNEDFSELKFSDVKKYFPFVLRVHASTGGQLQHLEISNDGIIEVPKGGWQSIDVLLTDHTLDDSEDLPMAISLSGGGFRAALIHLGALRRLNELRLLQKIDSVVAISGGSIASSFLAVAWYQLCENDFSDVAFDKFVAIPLRNFCQFNFGIRGLLDYINPMKSWRSGTTPTYGAFISRSSSKFLAEKYSKAVEEVYPTTIDATTRKDLAKKFSQYLYDALPDPRPEKNQNVKYVPPLFVMCGVDSRDGKPFYFTKFRCGRSVYPEEVDQAKRPWLFEMSPEICEEFSTQVVTLSDAIAGSAAYPLLFQPLLLHYHDYKTKRLVQIPVLDGGMYDNLAIECLLTPNAFKTWKNYHGRQIIFGSDAGAPVACEDGGEMSQTNRVLRCTKLLFSEISRSKSEVLIEKYHDNTLYGALWRLSDLIDLYTIMFSVTTNDSSQALSKKVSEIKEMDNSKEILSLLHFGSTGNKEIRAFFEKHKTGPYPIGIPDLNSLLNPESLDLLLQFRTDLNSMSASEIGIVENYGYLLATIRCHLYVTPFLREWKGHKDQVEPVFKWPHNDAKFYSSDNVVSSLRFSTNIFIANSIGKLVEPFSK